MDRRGWGGQDTDLTGFSGMSYRMSMDGLHNAVTATFHGTYFKDWAEVIKLFLCSNQLRMKSVPFINN